MKKGTNGYKPLSMGVEEMKVGDKVLVPWTTYKPGKILHIDESLDNSFDFQMLVEDDETGRTKTIDERELKCAQSKGKC